ncbi:hypothetical protein ACWEPC_12855 [Nonomuraea sp. NPDC004297]
MASLLGWRRHARQAESTEEAAVHHVHPRAPGLPERQARPLRSLELRPIGTNGYVSTWGAITGICPPKDV